MNTKEKIIHEALRLFSKKGYDAVSVRDIAGAVGIKESSLYYHFRNKQELFDTIVEFCFQQAKSYFQEHALPFDEQDDLTMFRETDPEKLTELIFHTFGYFFDDPCNVMFRRLLLLGQYENERIREIYKGLYREYPLKIQREIFAMLMERGLFRKEHPESAAIEFYGVIYMLIHTCDSLEEAKPIIREHMQQFIKNYLVLSTPQNNLT
ncbi:MAG: TetR/AcrR family transcriptional regulator [Lachnospiraceae bacterium]|jgi:AcrR family transcriptional regulator|nr:TetR/AcrR family transcriptional regulator [Lachnospiraceae bacterium]